VQNHHPSYQVFGGKRLLITIIVIACCIALFQAATMMHLIPHV
jgi:hypothetical protein